MLFVQVRQGRAGQGKATPWYREDRNVKVGPGWTVTVGTILWWSPTNSPTAPQQLLEILRFLHLPGFPGKYICKWCTVASVLVVSWWCPSIPLRVVAPVALSDMWAQGKECRTIIITNITYLVLWCGGGGGGGGVVQILEWE